MTEKLNKDKIKTAPKEKLNKDKIKTAPKENLGKLPKGGSQSEREYIESLQNLSAAELVRKLQGKTGSDEAAEFRNGGKVSLGKFKGNF
jgi:hypothetical protein